MKIDEILESGWQGPRGQLSLKAKPQAEQNNCELNGGDFNVSPSALVNSGAILYNTHLFCWILF